MSLYARSLQPLITRRRPSSAAKQCWFADDATGSSSLQDVRKWWDELSENGPVLGYFPNVKKCWLITKPKRQQAAREVFRDTEVTKLAEFAISQTQASYAAFTSCLRQRWSYFLRTLPYIAELLGPLERAINKVLIPAVTDHTHSLLPYSQAKVERDLLGFLVRLGEVGAGEELPADKS